MLSTPCYAVTLKRKAQIQSSLEEGMISWGYKVEEYVGKNKYCGEDEAFELGFEKEADIWK